MKNDDKTCFYENCYYNRKKHCCLVYPCEKLNDKNTNQNFEMDSVYGIQPIRHQPPSLHAHKFKK